MKAKVKTTKECEALFDIEVPKEEIAAALSEVYDEITRVASIPGYRVGKAPKEVVQKHYRDKAREEALKRLIPDAYRKALEEQRVNPIGLPEIADVSFEEDKPLVFKAKVETRPEFKVKDYKGIRVEKKIAQIKNEDVDKTLENLREINARYISVEDRPLQYGDYAVSDMECFVDGKPVHKKRENLWIFMEKESVIPGLHEKMQGMKKGEDRDIEVILPEKYPDKNLAGKAARYHIKLNEIKARLLPDLNDEFAKDLGKSTLDELKSDVLKGLEARQGANVQVDMENQLLKRLVDDNVFPVPPSFLARQLEYMVRQARANLEQKGFKKEDLDKKDAEFKEKFKDDAVRQVRLFFILDEIARLENIDVIADDLNEAYKSISGQTGKTETEVREYYKKEGLEGDLEERVRETKTIDFLMKAANITEKK